MSYEPKGTVKAGLDALDKEPKRIWSSKELAETLQVRHSSISACFEIAVRHGRVHRRIGPTGQLQWRRDAFDDAAPAQIETPRSATGFVPAPMPVPRAGSDARHENEPPPKLCTGCSKAACWDNGCQEAAKDAEVVASAPTQAPAPVAPQAPPLEEPALEEVLEEEEEVVEPKAFIDCDTGEIVLIGCPADDEGRVTIPAALVERIKTRIAWSPVR